MNDIILTAHSVDRFRSRHVPHLTHNQAHHELESLLPRAVLIPQKSTLGQDQYLIEEPYGVILVCKNDPKVGIVAVTSLTNWMRGPSDEELDELRSAAIRNMVSAAAIDTKPIRESHVKQAKVPKAVTPETIAHREAGSLANRKVMAQRSAEAKAAKEQRRGQKKDKDEAIRAAVALVKEAKDKAEAKHLAHAEHMEQQATKLKRLIRLLMISAERFVGLDPGITEAWDTIAQEQPGLVTDKFLGKRCNSSRASDDDQQIG